VTILQEEFAQSAARLIQQASKLGYGVTFGEAYRTSEQAALNAKSGAGISNSLHTDRLAIDLNIFKAGQYITDGAQYADLGNWWTSLGPRYRWGQNFSGRKDGNHFSLSPDGERA
jgi:hypothetical protein